MGLRAARAPSTLGIDKGIDPERHVVNARAMDAHLVGFLFGMTTTAIVMGLLFRERAAVIRARALTGSRAALRGRIVEQMAPVLADWPYEPSDARFLGSPVDYVVFDGAADGDEIEVVLVEVKSGRARLTDMEVRVRDAVEAGRVRYEVLRFE